MSIQSVHIACRNCGAPIDVDASLRLGTCPYCGDQIPLNTNQVPSEIPPVDLIFADKVSESQFRDSVKKYLCENPDTPDQLYDALEAQETYKCFLPFWCYQIDWHASWSAESGYKRTRQKYDSGSKSYKEESYTEWIPSSGTAEGIDSFSAPGSKTMAERNLVDKVVPLLEALPPCDAEKFNPEFLAGSTWLSYNLKAAECYVDYVDRRLALKITEVCNSHVPGDSKRNLRVTSRKDYDAVKIIAPFWIFNYAFKDKRYVIAVDGVNGKALGDMPQIYSRIVIPVILAIIPLVALYFLSDVRDIYSLVSVPFLLLAGLYPWSYRLMVKHMRGKFADLDAGGRRAMSKKLRISEISFTAITFLVIVGLFLLFYFTAGNTRNIVL